MDDDINGTGIRVLVDGWVEAVRAFQHVAERMDGDARKEAAERLARLLEHLERDQPRRRRLPIRSRGRVYFLDIEEIDWLEAADNYVKVHSDRKTHMVRQTLQTLEESLEPRGFIRVHRSAIVNIARIQEIQSWFGGEYMVLLSDGTKLMSSRGYRSGLKALMES